MPACDSAATVTRTVSTCRPQVDIPTVFSHTCGKGQSLKALKLVFTVAATAASVRARASRDPRECPTSHMIIRVTMLPTFHVLPVTHSISSSVMGGCF